MDIDGLTYPFEEEEDFEDSVILRYGKKLFQMHFAYEDRILYWYVQFIGPSEEAEKFMFEVDVQDNTGGNRRIYFKDRCGELTTKDELKDLDNTSHLEYDQVKRLINSQLMFEVRVLEG